ncbi:carboxylesterase family protein [Corynebacterium sp. A21]|uniref:carboxylesterase family protein n=1 Tax=Corynebacterium sp. A21 TaxID=3457318 RepID=UPI003FD2D12F
MGEIVQVNCAAGSIRGMTAQGISQFHSIRHLSYETFGASHLAAPAQIDATHPDPGAVALSITIPAGTRPGADLPVLVYIHGGSYEYGSHEEPRSRGDVFARDGIITVTLGYRLGMPGFVRFHDDEANRYRGIEDCLNGLQWVQRNIEEFGGDPTNVTLAGQSAGAGIALWLARRDHFRGEFRRVMAMSPAFPRQTFNQRKSSLRMALGLPITRRALSEAPPADLVHGYRRFAKRHFTDMALGPALFEGSELSEIPFLLTTNREEFYHHPLGKQLDRRGKNWSAAGVRLLGRSMGVHSISDYLAGAREQDPDWLACQLIGDSTNRRWVARAAEQAPGPVWLREYAGNHAAPALHSADIPLFFHTLGTDGYQNPEDPRARELADLVHGDAVTFIRGVLPGWETYQPVTGGRVAQRIDINDPARGGQLVRDPLALVRATFT